MDQYLERDLEVVKTIVLQCLEELPSRVYLFGSCAVDRAERASDIDVAVLPLAMGAQGVLSELRQRLEEAPILRTVDLIDLSQVDRAFRERVEREGIEWRR